ncbi:MAG: hypothetical protein IJ153_02620 [Clostridia bacterium]|nr:hypothetical protein [Clostridia bacterium]
MTKKRLLCLVLALCALMLTACQEKEVFDTLPPEGRATEAPTAEPVQDLFGSTVVGPTDYDDGSYDPASEEGGEWEDIVETVGEVATAAPIIQSEYAGATPVIIDPIDKPTPTPLPTLSFSYVTYEASSLHLTFEGPSGWLVDDTIADTYTLTNPDPSMDYAAYLTVRAVPVNKDYSKSELTREVKGMLDTLSGSGVFTNFSPSNTAERSFLGTTGVYANYTAVEKATGAEVAGRLIVVCVDKTLYTLHVSYPRGYRDFYVSNVYDKFRHSVQLN